jgi:hypothetical protein
MSCSTIHGGIIDNTSMHHSMFHTGDGGGVPIKLNFFQWIIFSGFEHLGLIITTLIVNLRLLVGLIIAT